MSDAGFVTVLLPCFNAERFIGEAIESLLAQTYPHIVILALDDGSTDASPRIVRDYAQRDSRVRLSRSAVNLGLVATLNRGLDEAEGQFVARLDADDLAAPTRIAKSVSMLARDPTVAVVGTGARFIRPDGVPLRPRPVRCTTPAGARFMALFATPVLHSSILARADAMRAYRYTLRPQGRYTEDYELFARMIADGVGFANIDEPLITYTANPDGISFSNEARQIRNFVQCAYEHLARVTGLQPTVGVHSVLVNRITSVVTPADLDAGLALLSDLEAEAIATAPQAYTDIRRVADLQRVDIIIQAVRRGDVALTRAAARCAIRYGYLLRVPDARRYLITKLPGSRPWLSVRETCQETTP